MLAGKSSFDIGSSSSLVSFPTNAPAAYVVQNDDDAATGAEMSVALYSRTADGEVPQLQATLASSGGENSGSVSVAPGIEVSARVAISGAAITTGLIGSDAI